MAPHQAPARFALGTFSHAGCPPFAGLVLDGERVVAVVALRDICTQQGHDLPDASSTRALIEHWSASLPALQAAANALAQRNTPASRAAAESLVPISALKVHPPVASQQILMSGANYFKHVVDIIVDMGPGKSPGTEGMDPTALRAFAEALMHKRKREGLPYIFSKPVSVLSGAYDPIVIPASTTQPDWELELAVVIAAPARHVRKEDAMRFVAGYTIANDITNRDQIWTRGDMKPMGTDWIGAKSSPTYLPVGPYIVPASQITDPQDLRIELKLNGQTMQDESTADMIFGVARLIEHVSSVVQLLPGDLICTGSPAGNGTHYNRFLQPGDVVEGAITGLGSMRTPVISERT
jgi:2-keto-4-pentenoate hydratase/2-oxohepta-3-ene-1,7-dioic acid hydratase in catechol pathway